MVMDAAKTHNSTPPPGGGWVDGEEEDVNGGEMRKGGGASVSTTTATTTSGPSNHRHCRRPNMENLVPPDGGWGWVIVFANCIITFVLPSISSCFGVVYVRLVQTGYSNTQVAVIPAIVVGFANLLAPVSTGLSRYYSHRRLCMIGLSVVSLGLLLCSLYSDIVWFYFCYGGLGGLGSALAGPHGFLLGQQYFRHKRVAANGLSMIGASLGFMILPPFLNYLVEIFSADGTFMLWSGIILHGLVGAALFQPIEWHLKPKRIDLETIKVEQNGGTQNQAKSSVPGSKVVVGSGKRENQEFGDYEEDSIIKKLTPEDDDESDEEDVCISQDMRLNHSSLCSEPCGGLALVSDRPWKNPLTDAMQTNEYMERPRTVSIERSMEILPQIPEETEDEDCFETFDQEIGNERLEFLNRENEIRNRPVSLISTKSVDSFLTAPSQESIFNSNDVIDQFGSALSVKIEKLKDKAQIEENKNQNYKLNNSLSNKQHLNPNVCCGLKFPKISDLINFRILRHPAFLITAFSSIANRMVYLCFVTYLPAIGTDVGVGWRAPYLLTFIAAFELTGKILISVISDRGWLQRRHFYMLASLNASLAIFTLTFASDFISMGACCSWYGLSVGVCMSVGPVLLVEYMGLKLLPYTFGLLLFMNGISGLILFPVTGLLSDLTGSYVITCYVVGVLALVPAALWSVVPFFTKPIEENNMTPADNV